MTRPIQSKKRYIISFIIGTLVFLTVFLITYSISYFEFLRVSDYQQETAYEIFEKKLDYSLFNPNFCSKESFEEVSNALWFQGRIIDDLEKKLGKNNEKVLFKKKFYTLVELEHFEFVEMLKEKCDLNFNTILFFYSNEKSLIEESEDLGRLLDIFYKRNPDTIIYSFDFNLNCELIDKLKQKYNIEKPLTLIINNKNKIVNPKNIEELEKYLKE